MVAKVCSAREGSQTEMKQVKRGNEKGHGHALYHLFFTALIDERYVDSNCLIYVLKLFLSVDFCYILT